MKRTAAESYDDVLGVVLPALRGIEPAPERRAAMQEKLFARIRSASATLPASELLTVRAGEGQWREIAPGVTIKVLFKSEDSHSFLLRFAPGAEFPMHDHSGDEICYMLEGEATFGDVVLRAGDYHMARKGSRHVKFHSASGSLAFIHADLRDYGVHP